MSLRFSNDGPDFPSKLVDSLLAGEVVFLCGTGISAPQLPDFRQLVKRTYETLGVEKTDSEHCAFKSKRFEEVLGSLSRRLAAPESVTRTVSKLLSVPNEPHLDQHRTILRLSRDLDNRISVVTTNFDTLLERAAIAVSPNTKPRSISFAGQALPTPGSPSFCGIVHIHGRLADHHLGLESSQLVLTSADYGDAYMRNGWASRFLFDLARCKAIVLLGYSANDAPVRYFLNVLEADRARFHDLKPVFAFDWYIDEPQEAALSWRTLAVTPLPYCCKVNPNTGERDHGALWRDLANLAEIAERPKRSRRRRASAILERPATELNADSQSELDWLFKGRNDLWSVALKVIVDPDWFKVLRNAKLLTDRDAAWVISSWITKNPQDRERFGCALEWQKRLGHPFTREIERRLRYRKGLDETWTRVWRIFGLVKPINRKDQTYYVIQQRLCSSFVLDSDLCKAVSLLTPRLILSKMDPKLNGKSADHPILRLRDIFTARMAIGDRHRAQELVDSLCAIPGRAGRILELASAELRSTLELETELELIGEEYDENDFLVPSIEGHAQNKHLGGVNFLVRVLVDTLPQAGRLDRESTRQVAIGWKRFPGRIGLRLCLHVMRNAKLFDADEAMSTLLSISDADFWSIRRELPLLLKDRAGSARAAIVSQVEQRIRQTSDPFYDRYSAAPENADWRAHARDSAVWIRLKMLQDVGVLSEIGAVELSAITDRRDYLDRDVEERDFFSTYSSGARWIVGDSKPIEEAPEDTRLRVAHELASSPNRDLQLGWSAFCQSDPQGAFDSLSRAGLTEENGALWNEFLSALRFGNEASKAVREDLSVKALKHLETADADILETMASSLCYLIFVAPRERVPNVGDWLLRLWDTISKQPEPSLDLSADIYRRAINSPGGKLSEVLLLEISERTQVGNALTSKQRRLMKTIFASDGAAGQLGRAIFARNIAFLLTVNKQYVKETFRPYLEAETEEGAALRAVMLELASITPEISHVFRHAIKRGVVESNSTDKRSGVIASKILRPALAELRGKNAFQWGLTTRDLAEVLREAPQAIRCSVLDLLARWLQDDQAGTEEAWRGVVVPFFEKIWPREREFRSASLTRYLIILAVGSGTEFPRALDLLRPYISPYDAGYGSLDPIIGSDIPERFPSKTLELVWLVCGPKSHGRFYGVAQVIDRLIEADPRIEIDRRLQWLEQRAERLN